MYNLFYFILRLNHPVCSLCEQEEYLPWLFGSGHDSDIVVLLVMLELVVKSDGEV